MAVWTAFSAAAAADGSGSMVREAVELNRLSIEDLVNIDVSSVSKTKERLNEAAASVFVITQDDIRRSGARSMPEILRLAPNLEVAGIDSSTYAISARGFDSSSANKLLVLIDGRSVYTPLYSGVFWDVQDVMPENIDRIEVISGPAGAIWGGNAVNGVINIVTKNSAETQGAVVDLGGGNYEHGGAARYGGRLSDTLTYRVSVDGFDRGGTTRPSGANAHDSWSKTQESFRLDWSPPDDLITVQGDHYDGSIAQAALSDKTVEGSNLLARWSRRFSGGSDLAVQAYWDETDRLYPGSFQEKLATYDIDFQHSLELASWNSFTWGGGYRSMHDHVVNSRVFAFLPSVRTLTLADVFGEDKIALSDAAKLTLGIKYEHNSFTGGEFMPDARLSWSIDNRNMAWAAVSRAVRTPSRIDTDFYSPGSPPYVLAGGPNFVSEKEIANQVGYRAQPAANLSLSLSAYYNIYDDLRTVDASPGGRPPYTLGNAMRGNTYGLEAWATYDATRWWRLAPGLLWQHENLQLKPGSTALASNNEAEDPVYQLSLRSSMDLRDDLDLDLTVRQIGSLPNPHVSDYFALDAHVGWRAFDHIELSLTGTNLTEARHIEFVQNQSVNELGRTIYVNMRWTP